MNPRLPADSISKVPKVPKVPKVGIYVFGVYRSIPTLFVSSSRSLLIVMSSAENEQVGGEGAMEDDDGIEDNIVDLWLP